MPCSEAESDRRRADQRAALKRQNDREIARSQNIMKQREIDAINRNSDLLQGLIARIERLESAADPRQPQGGGATPARSECGGHNQTPPTKQEGREQR